MRSPVFGPLLEAPPWFYRLPTGAALYHGGLLPGDCSHNILSLFFVCGMFASSPKKIIKSIIPGALIRCWRFLLLAFLGGFAWFYSAFYRCLARLFGLFCETADKLITLLFLDEGATDGVPIRVMRFSGDL